MTRYVPSGPPRQADALLLRPDGHIAWAANVGEPADTAATGLRAAMSTWCGAPAEAAPPVGEVGASAH